MTWWEGECYFWYISHKSALNFTFFVFFCIGAKIRYVINFCLSIKISFRLYFGLPQRASCTLYRNAYVLKIQEANKFIHFFSCWTKEWARYDKNLREKVRHLSKRYIGGNFERICWLFGCFLKVFFQIFLNIK